MKLFTEPALKAPGVDHELFPRRVVGWSAQPRMTTDPALQALLAAVWRRKPKAKLMIHSDQGSQFTSREWQMFLAEQNLEPSMSRRGIAMITRWPKASSNS